MQIKYYNYPTLTSRQAFGTISSHAFFCFPESTVTPLYWCAVALELHLIPKNVFDNLWCSI